MKKDGIVTPTGPHTRAQNGGLSATGIQGGDIPVRRVHPGYDGHATGIHGAQDGRNGSGAL